MQFKLCNVLTCPLAYLRTNLRLHFLFEFDHNIVILINECRRIIQAFLKASLRFLLIQQCFYDIFWKHQSAILDGILYPQHLHPENVQ